MMANLLLLGALALVAVAVFAWEAHLERAWWRAPVGTPEDDLAAAYQRLVDDHLSEARLVTPVRLHEGRWVRAGTTREEEARREAEETAAVVARREAIVAARQQAEAQAHKPMKFRRVG